MTHTETTMAQALKHLQAGNMQQAEALYRQVLDAEPQNVDALYSLGVVCQAQGRVEECMALYRQCLRINPDFAEVFNNLGVALASQGRLYEARTCYEDAVHLKPDYSEAIHNLERVLSALGTQIKPNPATAEELSNWGVNLMGQGRHDEALAIWKQALTLKEMPETHNNLGYLYATRGHWSEAIASYRAALALNAQYAEAWNNLGIAHYQLQKVGDAIDCFQKALAQKPEYPEALNNLGNTYLSLNKLSEARNCYRQALRMRPDNPQAIQNLAVVCTFEGNLDEAADCWRRCLSYDENNSQALRHLGAVLHLQGKRAEALLSYQKLLTVSPDDLEVRFLVEVLSNPTTPAKMPVDFVAGLFDSYAANFDRELVERLDYHGPEQIKTALGAAPPQHSLDILDLGCGTGLCGLQFREWAKTLIGVDISSNMLSKARERAVYDELSQSDLLAAMQGREDAFDLILAADVFVYVGDLWPIFQAGRRALRPGGRFAFTVELSEGSDYRLLPTVRFAHSHAYLHQLASTAGMNVVTANPIVIRMEKSQKLPGLVVVLSRE